MVRRTVIGVTLVILGIMFVAAALNMRPFGEPPSAMDDYIIANSQQEAGANNTVAAVVFDYRGYDTLGEATVLFTAVTAVIMLFRKRMNEAAD
ncbi:hydrogen gas-evolving membrane-bound hydrogenase subunit E [Chloroflexota bacterium]